MSYRIFSPFNIFFVKFFGLNRSTCFDAIFNLLLEVWFYPQCQIKLTLELFWDYKHHCFKHGSYAIRMIILIWYHESNGFCVVTCYLSPKIGAWFWVKKSSVATSFHKYELNIHENPPSKRDKWTGQNSYIYIYMCVCVCSLYIHEYWGLTNWSIATRFYKNELDTHENPPSKRDKWTGQNSYVYIYIYICVCVCSLYIHEDWGLSNWSIATSFHKYVQDIHINSPSKMDKGTGKNPYIYTYIHMCLCVRVFAIHLRKLRVNKLIYISLQIHHTQCGQKLGIYWRKWQLDWRYKAGNGWSEHTNSLQWRHNGRDGVSNHQPYDCLLNRLFRSKKTSKLRVIGEFTGDQWIPRTKGQ